MNETGTKGKRRNKEQWQGLIEAQSASEMSQAAFCAANGLKLASFQNWKRRLAAGPPTVAEPWVELGTLDRSAASGWEIELDLGRGVCLRFRRC